ncbi:MAG: sulfite exporter TauE/SafE family protein [Candidatus Pacebacteria bacterium]|nr:sulfite exporter TauE/SafE family protein [Candidatus Paceibacterota bacterium]MCD8508331.1 sulfite exporter TauE/SafE family protein [Candidatus Paceibacterota bacterium]MCD8527878.1 sulfite exporter TauE/SafE family protein [Candidatus Paceibacterota bacterium]MCD8564008.1 sulfite exporter TauE/SafE family protein [Candidatus Paceibacterota bacterium]
MEYFGLIIAGLVSGIISGITGASGVMIMIPLLTTFFGVPLLYALGTSLMADVISSGPIAWSYYRAGYLHIRTALLIISGAFIGTFFATGTVEYIPEFIISVGVILTMLFLGMRMMQGPLRSIETQPLLLRAFVSENPYTQTILAFLAGLILGMLTGFFGAGGGIFVFIVVHFIFRLDVKTSIGTAAGVMFMSAFSGALGYWRADFINLTQGLIIGIAAAIGGVISAHIAHRISEETLSRSVGVFLLIAACALLLIEGYGFFV